MKTLSAKKEEIARHWYIIDAEGKTLGRMASTIAHVLRGKHKPNFTPHVDCGDFVIVINAGKVHTTGNRVDQKFYHSHSGYPGGLRSTSMRDMLVRKPEFVTREAVRRMLPKGPLGRQMLRKLKIYAGPEHPHEAQQPETLELRG